MNMKLTYGILVVVGSVCAMTPPPGNVGNFWVDASGNAELEVSYAMPIKTTGSDNKIVESVKQTPFTVKLGNLATFSMTPKDVTQKIQQGLAQKFKTMNDQDLLKQTGSATFGRDANKWVITLDDKPFDSYTKDAVLSNDINKMKTAYTKGLQAKYVETSTPSTSPVTPSTPQAPVPQVTPGKPVVQGPSQPAPAPQGAPVFK